MLLNIFHFNNNLVQCLGWNHSYITGPHVVTASVESRMISLKEHFPSYWRMYHLMFVRACGFNMTVNLTPFQIMGVTCCPTFWRHGLAARVQYGLHVLLT